MGVSSGVASASNVLQPVILDGTESQDDLSCHANHSTGDKSPLPELTQLSSHSFRDFKFDYHAEFIAQPISYTDMVISSLAESPGSDTLSSMTSCDSLQSSNILQCAGTTCVSSVAALDNLPSFTGFSDSDYTQSIMTTIEPRVFGSEAEYINRLKNRRDSCQDLQRHSVIVSPSQIQDPPPSPPSPSLGLLPASFQTYLSDNTHSDDKILLKEEPQVTTKVDDIFLSTDFGGLRGGPAISSSSTNPTAA